MHAQGSETYIGHRAKEIYKDASMSQICSVRKWYGPKIAEKEEESQDVKVVT
jgi:hypothetical protein